MGPQDLHVIWHSLPCICDAHHCASSSLCAPRKLSLFQVTAFITVSLIYFQLAREDYHWWWRSLFCGGSTGTFIYTYSFFYFFNRSSMEGVIQGSFYFGYMAIISYAFFLVLGFTGFYSTFAFICHIYSVVKAD